MTLLTRCAAVLTVLLGLALMAVSVYAAKIDVGEPRAAADIRAEGQRLAADGAGGTPSALSLGAGTSAMAASTAAAQLMPTPTPTVAVRFPAPVGAPPVVPARSGRDNLSPGARVWPVLSLKPGLVNFAGLGQGGLDIPPEQLAVMQQVSLWTGIPWQIFGAIAKVESDLGRNMATSSAGAIGYGQFLPETWAVYGNGGDPYDFRDVIPAMGRYLLATGAPADIAGALYAYNHSWPYVAHVLSYASAYGYQAPGTSDRLIWPVVGPISSYFGPRHPLGIDIDQTMVPGAPVRAAHDGAVLFAGGDPCCSYGRYVILVAPAGIMTLYGHLDILAVASGQTVWQAQPLGTAGCTGYCTGTHLHFEVIENGVRRNPLDYLP